MKIIHLISNHKFTGPVDPALLLAQGLQRLEGVDVLAGVGTTQSGMKDGTARAVARQRGLPLITEELHLKKHRRWLYDARDVECLKKVMKEFSPDIVHGHVGNDFRLAVRAGARVAVCSLYGISLKELRWEQRRFVLKHAAGFVVHSISLYEEICALNRPVLYTPPVVDLERFDPERTLCVNSTFTLPEDRVVAGIVARMQPHRRFDVLLEAFKKAVEERPELCLCIVGRGTRADEVAKQPVKEMGLADHVVFPGYLSGDDYVSILKKFEFLFFLVPGTDGTCRALREGLAMGVPVIGSTRGMIPELIDDGQNGRLVHDLKSGLCPAIVELAGEKKLRRELGKRARKSAQAFDMNAAAEKVRDFYAQLLAQRSS